MDASIRVATPSDAAAVRDIYASFCESSAVTFEETSPTEAEMAQRIISKRETTAAGERLTRAERRPNQRSSSSLLEKYTLSIATRAGVIILFTKKH